MPGVNLLRTPGPANKFMVAGLPLPGIARVTGCVDQRKIDVQAGSGTKGATLRYQGADPQEFEVRLQIADEDEFDEWLTGDAAAVVRAVPEGKGARAYAVEHPSCLECGITAAVTKSVAAAEKQEDGGYLVVIKLLPSSPPKPSSGTPKGSATQWTSKNAQPPDAQSAADKTIEQLTQQIKDGQ
jgi:hypothetical protein